MDFYVFVFGLIVGSFLNAVIHRLHTGQSIISDSSRCPDCGHKLSATDLIPVVSFFVLKKKCRYCGQPISWQYPLVEIATAIAFLLIFNRLPGSPADGSIIDYRLLFQWIFASFLIIIFVYDLKHYLILDKIVFFATLLVGAYQIWQGNFFEGLLGAAVLSGFFSLLFLVSKGRWIGLGDVKLGIFLGLLVPWPQTLALFFLAYLIGALVSIVLLAWGEKKLSDKLPFGTFLTLSGFLAMLWGEELTKWYLNLIGFR